MKNISRRLFKKIINRFKRRLSSKRKGGGGERLKSNWSKVCFIHFVCLTPATHYKTKGRNLYFKWIGLMMVTSGFTCIQHNNIYKWTLLNIIKCTISSIKIHSLLFAILWHLWQIYNFFWWILMKWNHRYLLISTSVWDLVQFDWIWGLLGLGGGVSSTTEKCPKFVVHFVNVKVI